MSNNALPTDYVRPSLAEFLSASKAHTAAEHVPWCERYEAALRRHSAPPVGAPELVAAPSTPEVVTLGDPDQPWQYVRDAGGIITGTHSLAAEPSEGALPELELVAVAAAPELAALGDADLPWEYVRDAGGIITGTRPIAGAEEARLEREGAARAAEQKRLDEAKAAELAAARAAEQKRLDEAKAAQELEPAGADPLAKPAT
jgi:hypothetical protein